MLRIWKPKITGARITFAGLLWKSLKSDFLPVKRRIAGLGAPQIGPTNPRLKRRSVQRP